MSDNRIYQGGTADVDIKIRNRSGDFVDPAGLSCRITIGGSVVAAATHGGGASVIEKVSTGIYCAHLTASWAGRWLVEALATGPQERQTHTFDVLP